MINTKGRLGAVVRKGHMGRCKLWVVYNFLVLVVSLWVFCVVAPSDPHLLVSMSLCSPLPH